MRTRSEAKSLNDSARSGLVSPEALTLRLTHIEVLEYEHAKRIGDEWTEAGRQMRVRREAAGLSLRKLAAMLEVSPPFLSDMERGFRHYTIRYAAPALKIFGANTKLRHARETEAPAPSVEGTHV